MNSRSAGKEQVGVLGLARLTFASFFGYSFLQLDRSTSPDVSPLFSVEGKQERRSVSSINYNGLQGSMSRNLARGDMD